MVRKKRKPVEEFHTIDGYPNYIVSSYGYVLNTRIDHELKPSETMWGALKVGLIRDGKTKTFRLHRLVAKAFLPDYDENYQVEFINGVKTDCAVVNLRMSKKKKGGKA